jgi:DNA replication and repair protein RecF
LAIIKNISFFQFKNYKEAHFEFSNKINCIYGVNGIGKTNILDAIYFLSFTKSYFAKKDSQLVLHQHAGMSVRAQIFKNEELINLNLKIKETGKKEILVNNEEIKQVQNYLGTLSSVIIAPDDINLITEGGEYRRKYLDAIICQIDKEYLQHLLQYNKVLLQRNALLKNWQHIPQNEQSILPHFNALLHQYGTYIFTKRKQIIDTLFPEIMNIYNEISEQKYSIQLKYNSQLMHDSLEHLLTVNNHKEIASQRTNYGIHKDDIIIELEHQNLFKEYASQGQRKTMLFALKLAQFLFLKKYLNDSPILLLDDVFEKLDAQRAAHLLHFIQTQNCQTIITDTHQTRLQEAFGVGGGDLNYIGL